MSWTTWDFEPLPLVAAAAALALFAGGFLRLRRRAGARYANGWRVPLLVLAAALATLPVISPLDQAGDEFLLAAHVLQHVLLGDAAPRSPWSHCVGRCSSSCYPLRSASARTQAPASRHSLVPASSVCKPRCLGARALGHQAVHDVGHLSFLTVGLLV
jgi:Cytochrome c oxidase caa3 assembly factor (Caa3_CtaG)